MLLVKVCGTLWFCSVIFAFLLWGKFFSQNCKWMKSKIDPIVVVIIIIIITAKLAQKFFLRNYFPPNTKHCALKPNICLSFIREIPLHHCKRWNFTSTTNSFPSTLPLSHSAGCHRVYWASDRPMPFTCACFCGLNGFCHGQRKRRRKKKERVEEMEELKEEEEEAIEQWKNQETAV